MTDPTIAAEVARTTKFHDQTRKAAVLAANAGDDPALLREAAVGWMPHRGVDRAGVGLAHLIDTDDGLAFFAAKLVEFGYAT